MQSEPGALEAAIRAAQTGELAAFNTLVEYFQRQVYNVCFRTLGNAEDAADATQDAFLGAFRGISSFRGPGGGFRPWLLRIAVNACYDQLRRRQRRPADSLTEHEGADDEASLDDRLTDTAPGPEQQALSGETARRIETALAQLSADHRLTIVLCDVQGLSYEHAAATMQVELGTVKSRLSRARAHLRQLLAAAGELPTSGRRLEQRNP